MPAISARDLSKKYTISDKSPGIKGALKHFWARKHKSVVAVDGISFEINEGEMVVFIGPKGAGKTTTLKCYAD